MPRKFFDEAISPYLQNTTNIISRNILKNKEDEKKKLETKQLQREQENFLGQLLGGDKNVQPNKPIGVQTQEDYQKSSETGMSLDKQGRMLSRLTPDNQRIYEKLTKPKEQAKVKYKYDQPTIYQENDQGVRTDTGQKNPYYIQKPTHTVTDYNENNDKVIREFYPDGSHKDTPTGFKRKKTGGTGGKSEDVFDLNKFNKTINSFTAEDIKINKLRAEYNTYPDEAIKYQINALNESNSATLYNLLDDESRSAVDQFYDQLKESSKKHGQDFREIEKNQQEQLKKKFQETVLKNFDGSSEDYARKRALVLYSKFKYGYLY